jgi:hypothetical protein
MRDAFRGNEQPRSEFERPTYVISEFTELRVVLERHLSMHHT